MNHFCDFYAFFCVNIPHRNTRCRSRNAFKLSLTCIQETNDRIYDVNQIILWSNLYVLFSSSWASRAHSTHFAWQKKEHNFMLTKRRKKWPSSCIIFVFLSFFLFSFLFNKNPFNVLFLSHELCNKWNFLVFSTVIFFFFFVALSVKFCVFYRLLFLFWNQLVHDNVWLRDEYDLT